MHTHAQRKKSDQTEQTIGESLTSTTLAHDDGSGVGGQPRVTPGQPGGSRGRAAGR